jgi:hypothetical protein
LLGGKKAQRFYAKRGGKSREMDEGLTAHVWKLTEVMARVGSVLI